MAGAGAGDVPVVREDRGMLSLCSADGTLQSRMDRDDPARLVLEYTRLMMGFLLLHRAPVRIAMIGLGGGSLARYCLRHLPAADFTAIEICPEVIALRETFGIPPDGPRFRVLCEDGAAFVRRDGPALDVLLVDGFDGGEQPVQLCSAAFYDACRDRLAAGGILVVNLHPDDPAHDTRVERIRETFAGRVVVVSADGSDNQVVFAGADEPFPPAFSEVVERLRSIGASHPVGLEHVARKVVQYPQRARLAMRRGARRPASFRR